MKSMLTLFRIIAIISSLVFMIVSIRSKKKSQLKCVRACTIGNMIYLLADLFVLPPVMDLYVGLEAFFNACGILLAGILSVIGIIVGTVRAKKIEPVEGEEKPRWPLLYILAGVCIVSCFLMEVQLLQNANIVLNHEPDGFSSDYYNIAVTDKAAVKVDVGENYFKKNGEECTYYEYNIIQTGVHTYLIQSKYHDPELTEIDRDVVERIYQFDDFKKNDSVRKLYGDDMCYNGLVRKIVGTDYYLMTWLLSDNSEIGGGGTVYGEAIFLGDKFIGNIDIGDIDKIIYYE